MRGHFIFLRGISAALFRRIRLAKKNRQSRWRFDSFCCAAASLSVRHGLEIKIKPKVLADRHQHLLEISIKGVGLEKDARHIDTWMSLYARKRHRAS